MLTLNVGSGPLIVRYDVQELGFGGQNFELSGFRQVLELRDPDTGEVVAEMDVPLEPTRVDSSCDFSHRFYFEFARVDLYKPLVISEPRTVVQSAGPDFQLRSRPNKRLRLDRIATQEKRYYCLRDTGEIGPDSGREARFCRSCGVESNALSLPEVGGGLIDGEVGRRRGVYEEGISPGFFDNYPADICDQAMNVSGVPDGVYLITADVNRERDGDRLFVEEDTGDNRFQRWVEFSNMDRPVSSVRTLDRDDALRRIGYL